MQKFTLLACMAILAGCSGPEDTETPKAEATMAEQPMKHEGKITQAQAEMLKNEFTTCIRLTKKDLLEKHPEEKLNDPAYLKKHFGITEDDLSDESIVDKKLIFEEGKEVMAKCKPILETHSLYGRCALDQYPKFTNYKNVATYDEQSSKVDHKWKKECAKHVQ